MVTWRPMRAPGSTTVPCPIHEPSPIDHRPFGHRLLRDRPVDVLVAVVLVGDVHVVTRPHVVADLDREVPDDAAALADQASVADAHHRVAQALLAGHHARRQRDAGAEHRALADVDVALVEDRVRREADDAAAAEVAERSGVAALRPDRTPAADGRPRSADGVTGEVVAARHGCGGYRPTTVTSCTPPTSRCCRTALPDDARQLWSAIDRLVVDYARGIDDRDWVTFRTVFADVCEVDFRSWSGAAPATMDSDLWVQATRSVLGGFDATQHLMTNLRIGTVERSAAGVPTVLATNEVQAQHWFDGDTMAGFDRPAEPAWCTLGGMFTNRYEAMPLDEGWRWIDRRLPVPPAVAHGRRVAVRAGTPAPLIQSLADPQR